MSELENAPITPSVAASLDAQAALHAIASRGDSFIATLRNIHAPPTGTKTLRRYRIKAAAIAVGRSESWLRQAESDPLFPAPADRAKSGARMYSLAELNAIRKFAGTTPEPVPKAPYVLAFVNFKGGSSKTTCSYLASHFLASKGYRVLLVDLDPQASLTGSFELFRNDEPVQGVDWEQTVGPILAGELLDASDVVHQTHWPTIDIIPASVDVYDAELIMTNQRGQNSSTETPFWQRLDSAIRKTTGYDFVLLDSAPALNMSALNAVVAADGLIIPVPPRNLDLEAAVKFAKVVHSWIEKLPGFNTRHRWLRLLLTQFVKGSVSDQTHAKLAERIYGSLVLNNSFPMSEAIRRGSAGAPSCYEGDQVGSNAEASKHVREALDYVFQELLDIVFERASR